MNKKVIISLVLVALMGFGTAIGTFAYFTSQDISAANVFTAGTLTIEGPDNGKVAEGILNVGNIYPGWQQTKTIEIKNTGSLPFKYRVSAQSTNYNALFNGANGLQVKINDGSFMGIDELTNVLLGTIGANKSENITFTFMLPTAADNNYKGLTDTIKFVFDATQVENSEDAWNGTGMALVNTYNTGKNAENRNLGRPHINYTIDGNKITFEFVNPTYAYFAFDYRVDGEDGVAGEWAETVIKEGELVGQKIGPSYNTVNVPAGESRTVTVTAAEEVWAGLRLGGEQNWFLDWIKFEVK
ncbi:MAG: hypothetical protein K0R80_3217 [Clostridia bacterium]|nr:hypothetical protein [Clostridia bacterium]